MADFDMKSFEFAVSVCENTCYGKKDLLVKARDGLLEYVKKIEDSDVKIFALEALSEGPYQFWLSPCSSTGKYHPPEDQDVGGVVRHSIKASEIALENARPFGLTDEERDCALAATILHDIQKDGIPWTGMTDYRHGLIASDWLEQFSLEKDKKEKIKNAVRYHMWKWCEVVRAHPSDPTLEENKKEIERALNASPLERVVQIADYNASRKGVSSMPGIDVIDHPLFIEKYGKVKRDGK